MTAVATPHVVLANDHYTVYQERDGYFKVQLHGEDGPGSATRRSSVESCLAWAEGKKTPRRRFRSDFKDFGASAGEFSGGTRRENHKLFREYLGGMVLEKDEVKLSTAGDRELGGVAFVMAWDAKTFDEAPGVIFVNAEIDQALKEKLHEQFGVLVLVVPWEAPE